MKKTSKYIILTMVCLFVGLASVNALEIQTVACGNVDNIPQAIPRMCRNIINAIKILVPIIIIILGLLDFMKAVMASETKNMQEYTKKFTRRIIAGVLIFFVVAIVQFVFRSINAESKESTLACISCFVSDEANCTLVSENSNKPKRSCSSYNYTEGCPSVAEDGLKCKTINPTNGSGTPSCVKACSVLGASECSSRSDCQWMNLTCEDK